MQGGGGGLRQTQRVRGHGKTHFRREESEARSSLCFGEAPAHSASRKGSPRFVDVETEAQSGRPRVGGPGRQPPARARRSQTTTGARGGPRPPRPRAPQTPGRKGRTPWSRR